MSRLTDSDVIQRYLYLGTDIPFYIRKNRPLDIEQGKRILSPLTDLINAVENQDEKQARKKAESITITEDPVTRIAWCLSSGTLIRNDECLFTLAFLARNLKKAEEKHKVYEVIPGIIKTSQDLFKFVFFYTNLGKNPESKGFGNGLKTAIKKWYDSFTPEELATKLATDSASSSWCHKDLISLAHIKLEDNAKMQVIDAAAGGIGRKNPSKTKPRAHNTTIEESILNESMEEEIYQDSEALLLYRKIKKLKAAKTINDVLDGIQNLKVKYQIVPPLFLRSCTVWEALMPLMEYRDIVDIAILLQDFKLLKEKETPFSVAYGRFINNMTMVLASKLHSIYIYQIMRLFEERQRYLNVVKEAVHSANNLALKNVIANPVVLKQFYNALNKSLLNVQYTGLNYLITLDLRSKQSKKRVFGNRLMSCQAAYVLLSLPIFKRESHVNILTFTEVYNELNHVHLTREMTFFEGCDHIQKIAKPKTKVNINEPIRYAQTNKIRVDVFLTIVDSLIRVNPMRHSPANELNTYNATMKRNARYIVVNLSRHQQDLTKGTGEGVLELVGCTEDTPKLISAFAKGLFR